MISQVTFRRIHFFPQFVCALVLAFALIGKATNVSASLIVDPDYYGSATAPGATRTPGTGLTGFPNNGGTPTWTTGGIAVDWLITDNMNGTWTYSYTLTATVRSISHLLLELSQFDSNGNDLTEYWEGIFGDNLNDGNPWTDQQGNPDLPGSLYGVKIDVGGEEVVEVEFTTTQIPVWGDIYIKDGNQPSPQGGGALVAYNTGIGTDPVPNATDFTNWIPRPDGISTPPPPGEAPEPTALIVWSLLIASGFAVRRERATPQRFVKP